MKSLDLVTVTQVIQNLSVIIASLVAVNGINSWRRESKWKRKYELAEDILLVFYQAKDSIAKIRNPFVVESEGKSRKQGKDEDPETKTIMDRAYVVYERLDKELDVFNELRKLKYRYKALFRGCDVGPFNEVEKALNDILTATHMLSVFYWPNYGQQTSDSEHLKHVKKMHDYESLFWSTSSESDKIVKRLEEAISSIEAILQKEAFK